MSDSGATGPGEIIAGRYRIERSIAAGGMAEVFEATDLAGQKRVAIKLLKPEIAHNVEAVERLRREGEVLRSLEHPAIVGLETFGKLPDGRLFIAMELLTGETLGTRIRRDGKMQPADLVPILTGACAGLSAAHERGIVHRDLKPDNVFLVEEGGMLQVKLLDFGISKITGSDKLTQTGEVLGTPRYMAPEQLSAERDLDGRTDVYAMGVMIYEALCGNPPFLASTPSDLIVAILHGKSAPLRSFRPDLSAEIEAVVARAMARARQARYATARELVEAFIAVAPGAEQVTADTRGPMSTVLMGSMEERLAAGDAAAAAQAVRPGTFSALARAEAAGAAAGPEEGRGDGSTRSLRGSLPGPVAPSRAERAPVTAPRAEPSPRPARRTPTVPLSSARSGIDGRVSHMPAVDPATLAALDSGGVTAGGYSVPMQGGRTLLIVGGLIAGALSAGLAIVGLKLMSTDAESEATEAQAPAGVVVEDATPATGAAVAPDADAGGPGSTYESPPPPPPAEGPPGGHVEPEGAAAEPMREARRVARRPAGGATVPSGAAGGASSPSELVREARAALQRGDAATCVPLVDRALAAGAGSLALRLRGDCLLRIGDRAEALKSYERFCIAAPDHPAISEVRAIVEGMGGRCD